MKNECKYIEKKIKCDKDAGEKPDARIIYGG